MIRFHKVLQANLPANVEPNQEHVWFTNEGSIFVANHAGSPVQMGLGFKVVSAVPSGVPQAPGLMRYSTTTQKYYFSTPTQWVELMTAAQAGSTGGPGYASGVIVTDVNNNFTSGDVEGALAEIADVIKPLMGDKKLPNYTGNVFANDVSGDWGLTNAATNRPSGSVAQAWLSQRETSDGSLVGFVIDKNGNMFVRYGDAYKKVATGNDTASIENEINDVAGDLTSLATAVNNMKLNVGTGLTITHNGKLSQNPTISLSGSGFVEKTGDSMTGNLRFQNAAYLKFENTSHNLIDFQSGQPGAVRYNIQNNSQGLRLSDVNADVSNIFWKSSDKRLYINYKHSTTNSMQKSSAKGVNIQAPLMVENEPIRNGDDRFPDENPENHYAFYADNGKGNLSIARGYNAAFAVRNPKGFGSRRVVRLEATDQLHNNSTNRANMVLSGLHGNKMDDFRVTALDIRLDGWVHTTNGIIIGSNSEWGGTRGAVNNLNRLIMHARTGRVMNSPTSVDQRYVAQMSFYRHERSRDEIHFNVADMGTHLYDTTGWEGNSVTVTAGRFRASQFENASSIKYKENIDKYDDGALQIVENLDVFKYNYKDDQEKNETVGFIIEKGVPEIAITEAGDALDPYAMTAILWKAVQELKAEVDELRRK